MRGASKFVEPFNSFLVEFVAGEILRFFQVPFLVSLGAIAAISAVVGLRNRDSRWSLSGRRKVRFLAEIWWRKKCARGVHVA